MLRGAVALAALTGLSLAAPRAAGAQEASGEWMGVTAGAYIGIDYLFEGFVVGGRSNLMVDPWGWVSLVPSGEFEFRRGLRDWQANGDVTVMPFDGVYGGGGLSWRNTIYDEETGRETRRGYSAFIGFRERPAPGRVAPQIELRWTFVGDLRPRMLTLGANYPLLLFR